MHVAGRKGHRQGLGGSGGGALKTRRTAGQSTLGPENGQEQGRDQSEGSEAPAASVKVKMAPNNSVNQDK